VGRETVGSAPTLPATNSALRCCDVCHAIYRSDFERCPIDGGALVVMATDPLIGTTIAEQYEVEALIGEGAMGRVYRVHHTRLVAKRHALKVLLGDLAASATMRMRFANEADAASRLEHPNIVGVDDFGRTSSGLLYLVMELVDGPTLGHALRHHAMPAERVVRIARQLALGLAHAHDHGVVHRDFKPDNILLAAGDTPRIADFGLAISTSGDGARLTTTGIMCTPLYAAPEQVLGRTVDHRADLYALGVTLFEMIAGAPPFDGEPQAVVTRKVVERARSISTIAPDCPLRLAAAIERLLEPDPDARFASAREVAAELEAIAAGEPMPPRPRRRRSIPIAAGALVALLALAGGTSPHERATAAEIEVAAREPDPVVEVAIAAPEPATPAPSRPTRVAPLRGTRPASTVREPDLPAQAVREPDKSVVVAEEPWPSPVPAAAAAVSLAPVPAAGSAPLPAQAAPPTQPPAAQPPSPPRKPMVAAPRVAAPRIAAPQIVAIDVEGALPVSVARRAVERVLPELRGCASGEVSARFAIADSRRATGVHVSGSGGPCVAAALGNVRTEVAPDVGDAQVTVRISLGDSP
jgi:serine/threonine-protein kinase